MKSKENYNMMIENERTIAKVINVAICVTLIAIFCTLFARAIYSNADFFDKDKIRLTSCPGIAGYWIGAAVLSVGVLVLSVIEGKVNRSVVRAIKFVCVVTIFILVRCAINKWDEYYLAYYTQNGLLEAWSESKGYFFRGEGFVVMNILSYILVVLAALDAYLLPFNTFKEADD